MGFHWPKDFRRLGNVIFARFSQRVRRGGRFLEMGKKEKVAVQLLIFLFQHCNDLTFIGDSAAVTSPFCIVESAEFLCLDTIACP